MKALRRIILFVSGLVFLASFAWLWLMHTTSGARLVVERATSAAGLEVAAVNGTFARGLELQGIRYASGGVEATVAALSATFDISVLPTAIDILDARAHGIRVAIARGDASGGAGADPSGILESLVLPFPLHIDDFRATDIEVAIKDHRQVIDSLELSATWYEDIRVHGVAVGTPELDADGEAAIDLEKGNRITSDVRISLKPALTGAAEPVTVRPARCRQRR
jgi:autotransporter translocation and assembly factor TamB